MNDIFNLEQLDDVSVEARKNLRSIEGAPTKATSELLSLFTIKPELSANEIVVGLFRKYGKVKSRSGIHAVLYNLSSRNILEKLPKGFYRLKSEATK